MKLARLASSRENRHSTRLSDPVAPRHPTAGDPVGRGGWSERAPAAARDADYTTPGRLRESGASSCGTRLPALAGGHTVLLAQKNCAQLPAPRVSTYAATALTCSSVMPLPPFGGMAVPTLDALASTPLITV